MPRVLAWLWSSLESSKRLSVPWADGDACELRRRHPTNTCSSHDQLGFCNIAHISINNNSTNAQKCPRCTPTEKHGFPCPSRIPQGVWSISWSEQLLCLADIFVPLRRMNWGEDLLCNRIKLKLKYAFLYIVTNFPRVKFWNFGTKLFPIVNPWRKINSCKICWT